MNGRPTPDTHDCQAGDIDGYQSPQLDPLRCRACGRTWWPKVVDGKLVAYVPSALPPRKAA